LKVHLERRKIREGKITGCSNTMDFILMWLLAKYFNSVFVKAAEVTADVLSSPARENSILKAVPGYL
jgi:hypothetical protein